MPLIQTTPTVPGTIGVPPYVMMSTGIPAWNTVGQLLLPKFQEAISITNGIACVPPNAVRVAQQKYGWSIQPGQDNWMDFEGVPVFSTRKGVISLNGIYRAGSAPLIGLDAGAYFSLYVTRVNQLSAAASQGFAEVEWPDLMAYDDVSTPNYPIYWAGGGGIFCLAPGTDTVNETSYLITGITQASSAVVTTNTTAANPFQVGSTLTFSGVTGMTQVNGLFGNVTAVGGSVGAWTATVNIDSRGFSAFSGTAGYVTVCSANYTATLTCQAPAGGPGFSVTWDFIENPDGGYLPFTAPAGSTLSMSIALTSAGTQNLSSPQGISACVFPWNGG